MMNMIMMMMFMMNIMMMMNDGDDDDDDDDEGDDGDDDDGDDDDGDVILLPCVDHEDHDQSSYAWLVSFILIEDDFKKGFSFGQNSFDRFLCLTSRRVLSETDFYGNFVKAA